LGVAENARFAFSHCFIIYCNNYWRMVGGQFKVGFGMAVIFKNALANAEAQ
jgi:hypothetical protein